MCNFISNRRPHVATLGEWQAGVEVPKDTSLEKSVHYLEGKEKQAFLKFVRGMLQWRPEDRKTAKQLLDDPWLNH